MNRVYLRSVYLVMLMIVATLAFNNCGRDLSSSSANQGPELIDKEVALANKGSISTDYCLDSESYSCVRRQYSESLDYGSEYIPSECLVIGGVELCPSLQRLTFNTAAAKASCPECDESYEYEETVCHLNLRNEQGLQAVSVSAGELRLAMAGVYERCQRVMSLSQEER